MKIVHIACLNKVASNLGVLRQMEAEHVAARILKLNWKTELWTSDKHGSDVSKKLNLKFNNFITRRIGFYLKLQKTLSHNDLVILRYMPLDIFSSLLRKKQKQKIIIYFHAKELSIIDRTSIFGRAFHLFNSLLLASALRNVYGIAAVTNELLEYYSVHLNNRERTFVYPNGVSLNIQEINRLPDKNTRKGPFKIAFITSKFFEWNGLEHLLSDIAKASNLVPFQLTLVGKLTDAQKNMIRACKANVVQYDALNNHEMSKLFDELDITLGAFNLGSVELNEACTLKVRQSLGAGIPVFSGHRDSAITDGYKYYKIGNPSIQNILEFATEMRNVSRKEVALSSMEFIDKNKILNDFFENIKASLPAELEI